MKINIAYFTSTGNTLWLAQKAKKIFENNNHQVELFEVIKKGKQFLYNCDLVGIFYPIWGSSIPVPLSNIIRRTAKKENHDKKVFLIGNYAVFTGDTGIYWKNIIEEKGYDVFYVNHVKMPINISIPGFNYWEIPEGDTKKEILNQAVIDLKTIVNEILGFKYKEKGKKIYDKLGGYTQRNINWIWNIWRRMFAVDLNECIFCDLCYRICPVDNIIYEKNKNIQFNSNCILCLKCYNLCPENAVLIGKWSKNTNKYQRYKGPCEDIEPVIYRDYVNE